MKVRVAGRAAPDFERGVTDMLMGAMTKQTIVLTRPKIESLSKRLQILAEQEAEQLFQVLADVIEKKQDTLAAPQLTYQDLMAGARGDLSDALPRYVSQEPVYWKPLSPDYYERKFRFYRNADNMFLYFGDLRRYFTRYAESIVRNRLGGVKVSVTVPEIEPGDYHNRGKQGYDRILLGNLNVKIFPNLDGSLLAMLKGRQWNEMNDQAGAFEAALFEGAGVNSDGESVTHPLIAKLVNGHKGGSSYRPLVMPAVQFWIQVRIPAVIYRTLRDFVQRASIRDRS